jgi:hypothetical protein
MEMSVQLLILSPTVRVEVFQRDCNLGRPHNSSRGGDELKNCVQPASERRLLDGRARISSSIPSELFELCKYYDSCCR